MKEEDKEICSLIGDHGLKIIKKLAKQKQGKPVQILTHCNAGWLACIDWGTATAPIYKAHLEGIPVHVWIDETRPRNQGARLTAWELEKQNIPYSVIADNTGGYLMQKGDVDMVITGTDRTTRTGDVANKIGTYLKALAAADNDVPFYVGLPSTTIDWELDSGNDIEIEQRDPAEVTSIAGLTEQNKRERVSLALKKEKACNYSFDITPSRLVTGLITERGICKANEQSILKLFPEKKGKVHA